MDNKDGYNPYLHWGYTGYHSFDFFLIGACMWLLGPKNHGASHLISSIAALQVECR